MAAESDVTVGQVRRALGGRRLIWFGTRGEDGEALLRFPELAASYAVMAPLRSGRLAPESNVTLEQLTGLRPDLDQHDIDLDVSEPAREFRRRLLREVSSHCAVVTYRPTRLVSAMAFSMTETMTLVGLFKDRQAAFEHKPWVETSLSKRGVRTLGWRYIADEQRWRVRRMAAGAPLVLRANRASGGVGIVRIDNGSQVDACWPSDEEGFVGVAPFLGDAMPLNLSGCVYANGVVRLHPPSVQLIGVAACTDRAFGYCGNDFSAISALDDAALDQLDELGRSVGAWLSAERYAGAFGIDALYKDGRALFTEVNARFQGSSALSAELAVELDSPDLFLEHVAASLGIEPLHDGLSVRDWARLQAPRSHVVVHNTTQVVVARDPHVRLPALDGGARVSQLLARDTVALPGATLYRLVTDGSVTVTGFELDMTTLRFIEDMSACFTTRDRATREVSGVADGH
jgi:hypothetical protein